MLHSFLRRGLTILLVVAGVAACSSGQGRSEAQASPSPEALKARLTPLQYRVTQQGGTEPPFQNAYWDNKHPGIYVDIVSGEPLFSSLDKFRSGTGWPSFTQPLVDRNVLQMGDGPFGFSGIEVRSKEAGSHLGHVFDDGPEPTGLRYCINSAALRFIPAEDLVQEGYAEFAGLFDEAGRTPATQTVVLAAGCFWCMEAIFEPQPGVVKVVSGYAGGHQENPSYEEVGSGTTGHAESIQITFDPHKTDFKSLLDLYWKTFDPTVANGVAPDFGSQYRSIIFYSNEQERSVAEASKAEEQKNHRKAVVTEILPLKHFYPAEDYHQDYVKYHPSDPYVQRVSIPRMARAGVKP